ncbi:MAG: hypothetical protein CMB48_03860 [Euryarchaeota archaeon]|nr:hypothetical protein [Euryarchaeota archaeon]|tara:strand:- start:3708 stop:3968 length:261 start_codon:yes stop_codon:yes gene_type:complete
MNLLNSKEDFKKHKQEKKGGFLFKKHENKLQGFYENTVWVGIRENMVAKCVCSVCGHKIDIGGIAPRLEGVKVYCKICGATTHHKF